MEIDINAPLDEDKEDVDIEYYTHQGNPRRDGCIAIIAIIATALLMYFII